MNRKKNTTIVSCAGKKADIRARIAQIKAQIEETTSDYDAERGFVPWRRAWSVGRVDI